MKLPLLALRFIPLVIFSWNFATAQQPVPFNEQQWTFKSQGHLIEGFQGYQNTVYLQNGAAILKDEKFLDGIIEFDVWLTQRASFSGFVFRSDGNNYEEIYFRPHQSGNPDAFQYTPVFNNDAAWQLYHDQFDQVNNGLISWKPRTQLRGYNGVITYTFDQWLHVKLVVSGSQAELYLDHNEQPTAFIPELGLKPMAGSVGVESTAGAAWFANFSVTHADRPALKSKNASALPTPPGTVMSWQVSNAFKEDVVKDMQQLDNKFLNRFNWKMLAAENSGLTNLSHISPVTDSTNTVLVKLTITSDKDQVKKLDLGYSDRVRAYCNGQILFSGTTGFRTRDYRYLGTIGYFDAIYLPLKKGENTVIFAVSETFGGWGITAKMDPASIKF